MGRRARRALARRTGVGGRHRRRGSLALHHVRRASHRSRARDAVARAHGQERLALGTAGCRPAHKDDVIRAIGAGAAGSWAVSNLGPRVVKRDFAPGFMIEHMSKDLGIALSEAERMGLNLPGLALAHQLYASLLRHGHGKDGTQALTLALEDTAKYKSL
mmetsp:Transcript_33913/g.79383  ORF Transcript_33913/g.79383 Transcript_33913/m.79383 type:complete len:160 (+) Transcript_33913:336-815(+)